MKKSDFGDILNKWENGSFNSNKNVMEQLLENSQIPDKDAGTETTSTRGEKRRRLLLKKPDNVLDIHNLTTEKAWLSLDNFFSDAKENNYQKLRIIHGKGNHSKGQPALMPTVRKYIEKCPFAGESGFEKSTDGGSGATWVLLKD